MASEAVTKVIKRRKIYVDHDVQGALLKQMLFSWLVIIGCMATVLLGVESLRAGFSLGFTGSLAAMWKHNAHLLIALVVLAPLIVYEAIKLSHRFAGPMVSFRRALHGLGNGESVTPVHFRENDYWKDLAESLNCVIERIERLEADKQLQQRELVTSEAE